MKKPASPAVHARQRQPLRVLCTEITPYQQLHERAERDLGFDLIFEQHDFVTAQRIAATEPERYDVYDQCFHNLDIVWHWRAVQKIELERIELWDEVNDLTKKGRINASARLGLGDAPVTRLYVQQDNSLSSIPSPHISMLPTVHNFDSFGVNETATGVDVDTQVRSWAELLDPRWKGHVAIVDEPAIGIFDIALAARAANKMTFKDLGNMSVEEIDHLIDLALSLKREGHFTSFWRTTQEATMMMERGDVWIASMWSPSAVQLKSRHLRTRQAVPVEGYRAWHGGLCLARHLEGHRLDQGYAYLNWFISGWPGAVVARQGYYMPVPERVREHLKPDEWDYWYDGKEARSPLCGPDGNIAILPAAQRSGGSYWNRASHIALWNTTMDEHNYLVRRWAELVKEPADRTGLLRNAS
ncbi:extracellular solute-binding protein [Chelativorans sp. AA-79]|uniref:ABC transporter substrate-binding protein n=1 Tax=Chelativorans sp. AA-79 TaxID=3028735 RepID=UPI0023F87E06|nr:extracellular solute-binding protein [Chelativorans sp. AA-79]WEX07205.1 extracellular solute-binding protein [Chelativorans sp. AA-79]